MRFMSRLRRPKGTPTGGQWVAQMRAAATVKLEEEEGGLEAVMADDHLGGYRVANYAAGDRGRFTADIVRDGNAVGRIENKGGRNGLSVAIQGQDEIFRFMRVQTAVGRSKKYPVGAHAMAEHLLAQHTRDQDETRP